MDQNTDRINLDVVAILDTMWGSRVCPGFFRINPKNFTGKRLYSFVGHQKKLWCIDSCKDGVEHARMHAKPDPVWLGSNLTRVHVELLLVCGNVAQKTFNQIRLGEASYAHVIMLPHPAARNWTKLALEQARLLCLSPVSGVYQIKNKELVQVK